MLMFMSFAPTRPEVRHLEALVAVAEEGTFRGAADVLGYSQAAISQQISALEAVVGAPVFDRQGGPRPVQITPVGQALLAHAKVILERLDLAQDEAEHIAAGTGGPLAIGTFQSVSVELLPEIVGRMRTEAPGLVMRAVEEDENEALLRLLYRGELDLAFIAGPVSDPSLDIIDLGSDPLLAVLPKGMGFDDHDQVPLRDVVDFGLIGEHHGSSQAYVEEGIRAHGIAPRYVFRTNDNGAMQAMVRNGLGAAIMPQLAIALDDPDVLVKHTDPPMPRRSIVLALRRAALRAPAAEHFAQVAKDVSAAKLDPPQNG